MNIIKDHLLSWRKDHFDPTEEGRVIVHDFVQVRGNIHRLLPDNFSSPIPSALISVPVDQITTFQLAVGTIRIPLMCNMKLNPDLEAMLLYNDHEHDNTLSILARDKKTIYIRLDSKETYNKWHLALREALAEILFTQSFVYTKEGELSVRKMEIAIKRGSSLIPNANCHMLRAKRLRNIKVDLNEILCQLQVNPKSISREDVKEFLFRAEIDRLILGDSQYLALKELEPTLSWKNELILDYEHYEHDHMSEPEQLISIPLHADSYSMKTPSKQTSSKYRLSSTPMPNIGDESIVESDVHWALRSPDPKPSRSSFQTMSTMSTTNSSMSVCSSSVLVRVDPQDASSRLSILSRNYEAIIDELEEELMKEGLPSPMPEDGFDTYFQENKSEVFMDTNEESMEVLSSESMLFNIENALEEVVNDEEMEEVKDESGSITLVKDKRSDDSSISDENVSLIDDNEIDNDVAEDETEENEAEEDEEDEEEVVNEEENHEMVTEFIEKIHEKSAEEYSEISDKDEELENEEELEEEQEQDKLETNNIIEEKFVDVIENAEEINQETATFETNLFEIEEKEEINEILINSVSEEIELKNNSLENKIIDDTMCSIEISLANAEPIIQTEDKVESDISSLDQPSLLIPIITKNEEDDNNSLHNLSWLSPLDPTADDHEHEGDEDEPILVLETSSQPLQTTFSLTLPQENTFTEYEPRVDIDNTTYTFPSQHDALRQNPTVDSFSRNSLNSTPQEVTSFASTPDNTLPTRVETTFSSPNKNNGLNNCEGATVNITPEILKLTPQENNSFASTPEAAFVSRIETTFPSPLKTNGSSCQPRSPLSPISNMNASGAKKRRKVSIGHVIINDSIQRDRDLCPSPSHFSSSMSKTIPMTPTSILKKKSSYRSSFPLSPNTPPSTKLTTKTDNIKINPLIQDENFHQNITVMVNRVEIPERFESSSPTKATKYNSWDISFDRTNESMDNPTETFEYSLFSPLPHKETQSILLTESNELKSELLNNDSFTNDNEEHSKINNNHIPQAIEQHQAAYLTSEQLILSLLIVFLFVLINYSDIQIYFMDIFDAISTLFNSFSFSNNPVEFLLQSSEAIQPQQVPDNLFATNYSENNTTTMTNMIPSSSIDELMTLQPMIVQSTIKKSFKSLQQVSHVIPVVLTLVLLPPIRGIKGLTQTIATGSLTVGRKLGQWGKGLIKGIIKTITLMPPEHQEVLLSW